MYYFVLGASERRRVTLLSPLFQTLTYKKQSYSSFASRASFTGPGAPPRCFLLWAQPNNKEEDDAGDILWTLYREMAGKRHAAVHHTAGDENTSPPGCSNR